jgi:hypothetical protein
MLKRIITCAAVMAAALCGLAAQAPSAPVSLFDGKTLTGWDGDIGRTWRIEDGAIVGGSLAERVPRNEFLCTTRDYTNFILRLEFKLEGTEGFINGGVQFRSRRLTTPAHEMIGYQADLGAGYWGALYDESRRNRVLAAPDPQAALEHLRPGDWNRYEVHADGRRIRLTLNGYQTVDYTEPDAALPQTGLIGLQIHGDGKALVRFRNITIQELP